MAVAEHRGNSSVAHLGTGSTKREQGSIRDSIFVILIDDRRGSIMAVDKHRGNSIVAHLLGSGSKREQGGKMAP